MKYFVISALILSSISLEGAAVGKIQPLPQTNIPTEIDDACEEGIMAMIFGQGDSLDDLTNPNFFDTGSCVDQPMAGLKSQTTKPPATTPPTTTPPAKPAPSCATVTIVCKTTEELRREGHVAACDQVNCKVHLSNEICTLLGYTNGQVVKPGDEQRNIKKKNPATFQDADNFCSAYHEFEHAIQPNGSSCTDEQGAFKAQAECMQHFYDQKCKIIPPATAPVWDANACLNQAVRICSPKGAQALNKCVCDKKAAQENPLKCQDCYDKCVTETNACNQEKIPGLAQNPELAQKLKCSNQTWCKSTSDSYCK